MFKNMLPKQPHDTALDQMQLNIEKLINFHQIVIRLNLKKVDAQSIPQSLNATDLTKTPAICLDNHPQKSKNSIDFLGQSKVAHLAQTIDIFQWAEQTLDQGQHL